MVKTKTKVFDHKTIKSYEDACAKLGIDSKIPEFMEAIEEFRKPLIAAYKLMIIFKAINDGWVADYKNRDQYKYFPYFWVASSGFRFGNSCCGYDGTHSHVGVRLCTYSGEVAMYIASQFEQEYIDLFLYTE